MALTQIDPTQALAGLRALKMVAVASHGLHETEAALLDAAAEALGLHVAIEELLPIEPEEVGAIIPEERLRTFLLEAMLLVALMDQDVDAAELWVIERFARALQITEPRLKNLQQFVAGHHLRLQADVARRSYFAQKVAAEAWRAGGAKAVWKAFAPRFGLGNDPELAWKYKRLGLLPEGTLGRIYWAHCTERGFSLPGESHGFPWQVGHDMGHVLANHGTDPYGEIEQAAFEAGYMKRDPFFLLFSLTMMFHLGFPVLGDNYLGLAKGQFDPVAVVDAFERGLAVATDLTEWDYWPHVGRPIDEVRRELHITPRADRKSAS